MNKIKENAITHGMSYTSTYGSWQSMKSRCCNVNNRRYKEWGGRGIKVCKRWLKFENFLEDMGEKPPGTSIERIDNSKGYSKSNCKWATPTEQSRNTRVRSDNMLGVKGVYYCKARGKFVARIKVMGKTVNLGGFSTIEEAKDARLKGEKLYW